MSFFHISGSKQFSVKKVKESLSSDDNLTSSTHWSYHNEDANQMSNPLRGIFVVNVCGSQILMANVGSFHG